MVSYGKEGKLKKESKRKETKRKHILSVSIEVSDIGGSHCIASAEHRWFIEHPYKATVGLMSTSLCPNRLDGLNLSYLLESDKKFKRKFQEWTKTTQRITENDFILFLEKELGFRRSNKNTIENTSVYKNFAIKGKLTTLRVSNHHYNHTHQEDYSELTSLVFTNTSGESLDWNFFQPQNDSVIEYTYNVEDFANEEMIEILRAVQGFLRSGIFSCSIKPDYSNKSQRLNKKEQLKAEKKQKKGMGVTSKRKETKRKHILSVSIEVSDIESSHGVASAEHGCFDEDPYRATGDLKVRTQCFNRLNGANVAYSSEYDKRFNRKIKEWQKLDTQISDLDMIFFLKQEMGFKDSKKNNHEHKSVYKEFEANGKKITLRVSDHHYINSQHSGKRHLTSLTFTNPLRESFDWNEFQPKEDNAVEYSYNVEDFTNREMIEILKAIQEFLRDGIYNCTIIPDKVNKSERHKQNELQKAEKKQKKGMGVTSKRKETERNHILSVSIEVSDIECLHCIASAKRGRFIEHPFKATRGTTPYTRSLYYLNGTNVSFNKDIDKKIERKIKDWRDNEKNISPNDFILLLISEFGFRQSNSNLKYNYESISAYYDIKSNNKKIVLRVSNHHHQRFSGNSDEELSSVVLDTKEYRNFEWNCFDNGEEKKIIEFVFDVDDYTCADFAKILKGIRSFLQTLDFSWSIHPTELEKTDKYVEWEQRKAEKKQKKGMGATNKNKRNEQNNSKPTPDDVKLVKTKLALKVKAAKILELIS